LILSHTTTTNDELTGNGHPQHGRKTLHSRCLDPRIVRRLPRSRRLLPLGDTRLQTGTTARTMGPQQSNVNGPPLIWVPETCTRAMPALPKHIRRRQECTRAKRPRTKIPSCQATPLARRAFRTMRFVSPSSHSAGCHRMAHLEISRDR
jgi:hypothetical protein